MRALQPGIPSPTTIPQNWHIIIIDLQDCFFNIHLHHIIVYLKCAPALC